MTASSDLPFLPDYLPRFPANRDVGIGCVGAGFIMDECHLVAYRAAGFLPLAIASRTREHAEAVARRHAIPNVHADYRSLLADPQVEVVDIAVPPDVQYEVVQEAVSHSDHIKGILAQKPLGIDHSQAKKIVDACAKAGIVLAVNQNMRYDQSIRALKSILVRGELGVPVLATIEMRAIPHWMSWQQRQGWLTLRIMSLHHLDALRFLFGEPARVFASVRPDPRTAAKFAHEDGICLYIVEYDDGLRAAAWDDVWTGPSREGAAVDIGIRWRVEGTEGLARGTIGWPDYPRRTPSTLEWTTTRADGRWFKPSWSEVWFPDAFAGPMAQLLCALEDGTEPEINGRDNLRTMALVDACYDSARSHQVVTLP
jgi:predicted dehydrogenase